MNRVRRVVVMGRSDATGGAAVVSRRLTEALRKEGIDARMLVTEKLTDYPYVTKTGQPLREKLAFFAERLRIFIANGFSRKNLFKVDTAEFGLPLWRHPLVKDADAVILNWVNQGMLSLKGVRKICREGKKVVWTMHDMWNLTGVCHHAMECTRYIGECGRCPYLRERPRDLSRRVWRKKRELYDETEIKFVAVSHWLAGKAEESSLLKGRGVTVIPNPISPLNPERRQSDTLKILFSAATLDNWIKGLSNFKLAIEILKRKYPDESSGCEVVLMGGLKNPESIEGFALPVKWLGVLNNEEDIAAAYAEAAVTVNSSHFENLPGTLVESQAYGAVPVAFDRGGQRDIISHETTGFLCPWSDDEPTRAENLAEGIARAIGALRKDPDNLRRRMRENVDKNFSYEAVAKRYLKLLSQADNPG